MEVLLFYLIGINILTFIMFNLDKWYAATGGWRISERNLIIACLAGGALGGYLGMKFAHHKTRKMVFSFGIPALGIAQLVFIIWLL